MGDDVRVDPGGLAALGPLPLVTEAQTLAQASPSGT
jgi:hypothetical protein